MSGIFSEISTWLLSVAGVSIISVIVDIVLPTGQTSKYIKAIFGFCIMLVIISPLPKLVSGNFKLDDLFVGGTIKIDEQFVYESNKRKLTYLETNIKKELENQQIFGIELSVFGDVFSKNMTIENVFVDLSGLVINENNKHINIKKAVEEAILKYVNIEKERIVFDG